MKGKKRSDLDKAADLLLMVASGLPIELEDQLWLENWRALMKEADQEMAPSVMFVTSPKRKGPVKKAVEGEDDGKDGQG
jgi:hypothetical protein